MTLDFSVIQQKHANLSRFIQAHFSIFISHFLVWSAVSDYFTFFSFVSLCMKYNTFFAFIKLSFLKTILTSQHALVIRLLRIPHKALSRPSIKSACVLKRSTSITQLKSCVQNIFSDTKTDHVGLGYRSHRVCHKQFAAFVLRNNASLSNQIT